MLPETDTAGALRIAENIRAAVERLPPFAADESPMTVSIGLSTSTGQPNQSLENLMYTADKALYQAKHRGRNCVVSAQE